MLPFETLPHLSFIQAGANDGVTNDWIYPIARKREWTGICLEPQRDIFHQLQVAYADSPGILAIHGALGLDDSPRTLYRICHPDPSFQKHCDPLASFDVFVLLRNAHIELTKFPHLADPDDRSYLEGYVAEEVVPCFSFQSLREKHQIQPDLLAMDIEGKEAEILLNLNWGDAPRFLFFECFHLPETEVQACQETLHREGYATRWVSEYGIERFNLVAIRS